MPRDTVPQPDPYSHTGVWLRQSADSIESALETLTAVELTLTAEGESLGAHTVRIAMDMLTRTHQHLAARGEGS